MEDLNDFTEKVLKYVLNREIHIGDDILYKMHYKSDICECLYHVDKTYLSV